METTATTKTDSDSKLILVNIRGNIYPMTKEEYSKLQHDTDWLVDMFKD